VKRRIEKAVLLSLAAAAFSGGVRGDPQQSATGETNGMMRGGLFPVIAPITEPAVGYGAAGALVFINDNESKGNPNARPDVAAVGGLATENGTRGAFAGHLGNWREGRLKTLVAVANADINMVFFGLGLGQSPGQEGIEYNIDAQIATLGGSVRLGEGNIWAGLSYQIAQTDFALNMDRPAPPGAPEDDLELNLAALTPGLTLDTRDNFFTPSRGSYLDASVSFFREGLGSDCNFEKFTLTGIHYVPLNKRLFLGARGTLKTSTDGTPFFMKPFVSLRGVQAVRYQGDEAAEFEAELRYQWRPSFSLIGFGGAGVARVDTDSTDWREEVLAGGGGFRYLMDEKNGVQVGLVVAVGPDDPIFYVVFGSAWLRP